MGFWLLVPGVGMGGGTAVVVTPNLWFTLGNERTEFTLPRAPDITTDDGTTEFTLEAP